MAATPWWIKPAAILIGLVLLVFAAGFAFGRAGDSRALSRSLDREAGAAFDGSCAGGKAGQWRCYVSDPSGSAEGSFAVGSDGDCWTARRHGLEPLLAARLHGCVALRDRYPFVGNFFDAWESL
jgi:hypothetical protein